MEIRRAPGLAPGQVTGVAKCEEAFETQHRRLDPAPTPDTWRLRPDTQVRISLRRLTDRNDTRAPEIRHPAPDTGNLTPV
jgi:hypothetical protein